LILAADQGQAATVKILLAHGADVHVKDSTGMTALMHATQKDHTIVVNLLQQAGAKE